MSIKIIGIAGGSGSGKTTLCRAIARKLGAQSLVISSDEYYRPQNHLSGADRAQLNFDHPDAIELDLLAKDLMRLREGRKIEVPKYCFKTHTRLPEVSNVTAKPIVLVEGVLIFSNEILREALDLRIFVTADQELRFQRRLERDVKERGRSRESVQAQWQKTVAPMFDTFVEPGRLTAHLTIDTSNPNLLGEEILVKGIANLLRE